MEQWEKNYYISSLAGATNGSSLVVMSKGGFSLTCCRSILSACFDLLPAFRQFS